MENSNFDTFLLSAVPSLALVISFHTEFSLYFQNQHPFKSFPKFIYRSGERFLYHFSDVPWRPLTRFHYSASRDLCPMPDGFGEFFLNKVVKLCHLISVLLKADLTHFYIYSHML